MIKILHICTPSTWVFFLTPLRWESLLQTSQIYNLKTRLGVEICSSHVNMHKSFYNPPTRDRHYFEANICISGLFDKQKD